MIYRTLRQPVFGVMVALIVSSAACNKGKATPPPPAEQKSSEPVSSSRSSSVIAVDVTESTQYYGVYLISQKAGWARVNIRGTKDGGLEVRNAIRLKIRRGQSEMTLSIDQTQEYEPLPMGRIRRYELTEVQPEGKTIRKGELKGDKFHVTTVTDGNVHNKVLPPSKEHVSHAYPPLFVKTLRASQGQMTSWQFDPQAMKDFEHKVTLVSEKKTRIQGVPATVLEVKSLDTTRSITTMSRITGAGRSLEVALGPSLKLVLEDKAVAQNPGAGAPDLYALSQVPVNKKLGLAESVSELKLKLIGKPPSLSLNDTRQEFSDGVLTVKRLAPEKVTPQKIDPQKLKSWLETTSFIDHKHVEIVAFANKHRVTGDPLATIEAISRAVNRRLSYTLATAPLTASGILAGKSGDCTEYTLLFVALARALQIPAREVSGMAYAGDTDPGFAFHAWAEAYVNGRWLAIDPTWNQFPVDATHIALSRDDPSGVVGVLGGLKAEVVSVNR